MGHAAGVWKKVTPARHERTEDADRLLSRSWHRRARAHRMREGALLWNKAFEAAGYRNAVQVKDPTPDMDPMDIRYAWILWINRDERGFSSGGTYRDPRTGEILGSKTRMDSHRIRTIGNYWESYTPTTSGGDDRAMFLPAPDFSA